MNIKIVTLIAFIFFLTALSVLIAARSHLGVPSSHWTTPRASRMSIPASSAVPPTARDIAATDAICSGLFALIGMLCASLWHAFSDGKSPLKERMILGLIGAVLTALLTLTMMGARSWLPEAIWFSLAAFLGFVLGGVFARWFNRFWFDDR